MLIKTLPFNYKQRDPQWANQRLGTVNGTTIGSDGCYITCFAMLASFYGHTVNPAQLDDLFTKNGWYINGNLLTDDGLTKAYSDIKYQQTLHYENGPADLAQLKVTMDDPNTLVVLEVDFNPETGSLETHFIVCTGCDGTNVTISDPWYLETDIKAHYGDPKTAIQKFVIYRGTPIAPPVGDTISIPKTKFEELVGKSTKYDAFVSAGYNSVDDVKNKIADMQKQIDGGSTKYYNLKQAVQKTLDSN